MTSSGRMQGIRFLRLRICAESSRSITLNKKTLKELNPCLKALLHGSDFVQQNAANYKLTNTIPV
jgi:hypothetical protein